MSENRIEHDDLLSLTAEIVAAYVGSNSVVIADLSSVISSVYAELSVLGEPEPEPEPEVKLTPAVPIKKSITDDFIICLDCGKQQKMLKRHLMVAHGLTPDQYRTKWRLGHDYPVVAPNYSATRKKLAKKIGLGRKPTKPRTRRKRK